MRTPLPPAAVESSRRSHGWIVLGLVAATGLVYANSFAGPFIFDDFLSIPQNPTLGSLLAALNPPGGGVTVTGRPILNVSFALNRALSGEAVWSYHLVNLLIHLAAGLTLFGLVRRTLARSGANSSPRWTPVGAANSIAAAVALLWLVHPLQTESVTYLVQRAESLMGLWYLLTLYCFARGPESARPWGWYAGAISACLLGMGTKEVMVSAPVLVLLYDRVFIAGSLREAWRRRWPVHVALACTWLPLALLVAHAANRGGSAGFSAGLGFWSYLATQPEALVRYLWLSFWGSPLIIDYGAQSAGPAWRVAIDSAVVAVLIAGTGFAWRRAKPLAFLGVLFWAVLAPTSLVPIARQTIAEHRMYLPLAAVLLMMVLAVHRVLGRRAWWLLAPATLAFGGLTAMRNVDYRSGEAIWHDTVTKRPANPHAHINYGNLLAQAERWDEALAQYDAALRLEPDSADALYNAGNALRRSWRLDESITRYRRALALAPRLADAWDGLGQALAAHGPSDDVLNCYRRAVELDGRFVDARHHLGLALAARGQLPEALAELEAAWRLDPSRAEVACNLGNVRRLAGQASAAATAYAAALQLDPALVAAHRGLGAALRELERWPDAIEHFARARQLEPQRPDICNDLGLTLVLAGRLAEAVEPFETALRLDPEAGAVHLNLAVTLDRLGRGAAAQAHYEAARRLGVPVPAGDR